MLVVAINKEGMPIFELGLLPSVLDDLSFESLIGKLDNYIWIHRGETTSYMFDVGLHKLYLKNSKHCFFLSRFVDVPV